MSYQDWRTRAIRNVSSMVVGEFVNRYRRGRPTVVLMPGGMGSQLDRSLEPFADGALPPTVYDTVWIDLGTLVLGQALTLAIEPDGRDRDGHVIVANGALRFLVNAYDATEAYFGRSDVDMNYVVFGYDWRRPLDESAAFLEDFLTRLQARVRETFDEDPLADLTLLAHSQGGLVAKVFLHRVGDATRWMRRVITVGTPFYGTWSHQRRYFVGEPALDPIHPGSVMAPIIATLPGPYGLMFPPRTVFEDIGAAIGLTRYPMRDPAGGDGADPFDAATLGRFYPDWVDAARLRDAAQMFRTIAAPLPQPVAERVYTVRSVVEPAMPVELSWRPLPAGFDPDRNDSPVQPAGFGPGDGTVPAWSAWHTAVPRANRVEFTEGEPHTTLMEDPRVLGFVRRLIEGRSVAEALAAPAAGVRPRPAAPDAQVRSVLDDLAAGRIGPRDPRLNDPRLWRGIQRELMR